MDVLGATSDDTGRRRLVEPPERRTEHRADQRRVHAAGGAQYTEQVHHIARAVEEDTDDEHDVVNCEVTVIKVSFGRGLSQATDLL